MSKPKRSILFSGMIAADPFQGGATWAVLQYVLGLRRLGYDVCFVEPVKASSLHPAGATLEVSDNARYIAQVAGDFGLGGSVALLLEGTRTTFGMAYEQLEQVARNADLLINISGMLTDQNLLGSIPVRAYLDLDPAFVQLWHVKGIDMRFEAHTHFVSIGRAIGSGGCDVPTCGREWIKTFQPVVLERWPQVAPERPFASDSLTTIGNFRAYGSVEHLGVDYGQKVHSLRRLMDLPRRTSQQFELAMSIHSDETNDLHLMQANGWGLVDPGEVAATPANYQRFIQSSKGEFGLTKSGYADSRCGWFSDRSACYLASGRPVIAQETGFSRFLPTGKGLWAFETIDQAAAAIAELNGDYAQHSHAARGVAVEYFDSDKVLQELLHNLGVG
jgi:hypothetical protein